MANVANSSSGESDVQLVPKFQWTVSSYLWGIAKVSTYWIDVHPREPWVLCSPTSKSLAMWDYEDGTLVNSWEIPGEALPPWGHSIFCAKFIAQKDWILIQCYGKAYIYETLASHLNIIKVLEHPQQSCLQGEIVVHPSLPYILAAFNEHVVLWDWEKGWEMITFEGHSVGVRGVLAFHPGDGNIFASASRSGMVKIWDISKGSCVQTLVCGDGVTLQLDFCSRGQKPLLLSCHKMMDSVQEQRTVLVWDYREGVCLGKLTTPELGCHSGRTAFFHPRLPYICSASDDHCHIRVWDESTLDLVSSYDSRLRSYELQGIAPGKRSDDLIGFGREGEFFVLRVVTKGGDKESELTEVKIERETVCGKRPRMHEPADDINEAALLVTKKTVVKIEDEAVCAAEEAESEKRVQQAAAGLTADLQLRCMRSPDALTEQPPTDNTDEPARLPSRKTVVKIEDEAVCGVEPGCEERIEQVATDLKQRCMQVLQRLRGQTPPHDTDEQAISRRTDLKIEEDESVCGDTPEPECEKRIQQVAAGLMDDPELRCMGVLDALRGHTPTDDIDEQVLLALRKRVVKIEDEAVCGEESECEEGIQEVAADLAAHLELRCMQALAALRGHTPTNDTSDEPSLLVWRKKALEFDDEHAVCAAAEPECEERIQHVVAGLAAGLEQKCMAALDALREEHQLRERKQAERIQELENELNKLKADVKALIERIETQSARFRG